MGRSIISAAGAISYLPRWAHILALVESLVLVAILVLVDIFLPGWDWVVLLLLPIAIFVSLLITKRKTRERKKEQLYNQSLARETDFLYKQIKKMENKMENRKQGTDHPSVGQETTKQSVVITPELKVIVATDNGVIENGSERVGIDGLFVIDAMSVARLLAALDGKVIQNVWVGDKLYITGTSQIINDLNSEVKRLEAKREETENRHVEELSKVKNEYKKDNEVKDKEIRDLYRESVALITEVNLLRKRVEKFNNTRRIWERKLDIDDISKTEIKDPTRRIGSFLYGPY